MNDKTKTAPYFCHDEGGALSADELQASLEVHCICMYMYTDASDIGKSRTIHHIEVHTPTLDALAREGVILDRHYGYAFLLPAVLPAVLPRCKMIARSSHSLD